MSNVRWEEYISNVFSEQELHQVFNKTNGLCYNCLNQIEESHYTAETPYCWFIVNRRNKVVFGQKKKNPDNLQPVCEKCLDHMNNGK